ncbi:O-acetylhomoserine aminocarboxypropyltransferase/cysteine synthase family protein [Flexivirga oryzae]|uniref:O-acetylhomoserine (Thiol)-lyase n=1 Tax=Flexivirga oryzae TaxID=1794944 RepID=A0A839N703_9MICO|nr:O-acetylhomoserine aminocarboxypropyltransferase/cysteine synthase family protein [Flexivirga oryzae]MBB2890995.1 O-acetylhomoserine (thiol)-lyase [Flexivirga oryzae]
MSDQHQFGFDTLAIHAGQRPDPETGARAMPIYATSSFVFEDAQQAADLFALQTYGNLYSRIGNPTVAAFEERIATLEGGLGAVATGSGLGAQLVTVLTLAQHGDEIVASTSLYGGTHTQFDVTLRRMGIAVTFVDFDDPDAVEAAITDRTKLLYGETIGNPRADVLDISRYADLAHSHGIPLVVDSTFASPYLCRPIEHGADIVVHSATKFIGGHGTAIAGVVVEAGTFPFDNGNFPLITEPSPAYHGLTFWENFREYAFLTRARAEVLRDVGAPLSPFNAFLLLLGLETLPLRMQRHADNAKAVAKFLAERDEVAWVSFPIFDDDPYIALAKKYLPDGPGAVFSFGLKGGYEACKTFIASAELASHLANVGDAKTLIIHPASTTHQQVPDEARAAAGVGDDLVRISVGIESIEDILWDLDQALRATNGGA